MTTNLIPVGVIDTESLFLDTEGNRQFHDRKDITELFRRWHRIHMELDLWDKSENSRSALFYYFAAAICLAHLPEDERDVRMKNEIAALEEAFTEHVSSVREAVMVQSKLAPKRLSALDAKFSRIEGELNELPEWEQTSDYRNALYYLLEGRQRFPKEEWATKLEKEGKWLERAAHALSCRHFIQHGDELSLFGRGGVPMD